MNLAHEGENLIDNPELLNQIGSSRKRLDVCEVPTKVWDVVTGAPHYFYNTFTTNFQKARTAASTGDYQGTGIHFANATEPVQWLTAPLYGGTKLGIHGASCAYKLSSKSRKQLARKILRNSDEFLGVTEVEINSGLMSRAKSVVQEFEVSIIRSSISTEKQIKHRIPTCNLRAWQRLRDNQKIPARITGGRSIADKIILRDLWATELYEEIRSCSNDVAKIAKNINLPEFQVQHVKNHLFYNTHQLKHGFGVGRFDPDLDIANAWKNLESGNYGQSELLLFKHEHFESRFEGIFRTDYDTAHNAANRAGHPSGLRNNDAIEVKNGNVNSH
jgi:hypothetical protein